MRLSRPAIALTNAGPSFRMAGKAILMGSLLALSLVPQAMAAKPNKNNNGGGGQTVESAPLALVTENYNFRTSAGGDDCLGEDDALTWEAAGELQPGESFTFTPQVPGCTGHPATIAVNLSWQGSELELTSNVPDSDFSSWDASQRGKLVIAPVVDNSAQLCMFPKYKEEGRFYTVTVTNVGNSTASEVVVEGLSKNDWPIFYYPGCINADADGDGWNDSLEHTMANLVYPVGYIDGVYQPYLLWGSNYLSADVTSLDSGDEIDSSPADLNDDGMVDTLDIDFIRNHQGEGNGIPLEAISPNPGDAEFIWNNDFAWRRYDLDGDGYVGPEDLAIVTDLEGEIPPMVEDIIAPTARVISPAEGGVVAKGSQYLIKGHVWDNAAITRVEYLVNGKAVCTITDPKPGFGYTSSFYQCWWSVPKRSGQHELSIRVSDGAGQVGVSAPLLVSAE